MVWPYCFMTHATVCPRSLVQLTYLAQYIRTDKTSWTFSTPHILYFGSKIYLFYYLHLSIYELQSKINTVTKINCWLELPFCSWWCGSVSRRPCPRPPRSRRWRSQSRGAAWSAGPSTSPPRPLYLQIWKLFI